MFGGTTPFGRPHGVPHTLLAPTAMVAFSNRSCVYENTPVHSPMNRGVPNTASPTAPSAAGAGGLS